MVVSAGSGWSLDGQQMIYIADPEKVSRTQLSACPANLFPCIKASIY
jgi:hypothetical protein